jgi:hypothetical protein
MAPDEQQAEDQVAYGKILVHTVLGQAHWQENHSIMALF